MIQVRIVKRSENPSLFWSSVFQGAFLALLPVLGFAAFIGYILQLSTRTNIVFIAGTGIIVFLVTAFALSRREVIPEIGLV